MTHPPMPGRHSARDEEDDGPATQEYAAIPSLSRPQGWREEDRPEDEPPYEEPHEEPREHPASEQVRSYRVELGSPADPEEDHDPEPAPEPPAVEQAPPAPSLRPTDKVTAATVGGFVSQIVVWMVETLAHLDVPPLVEVAFAGVVVFSFGYVKTERHGRHR
jgi:hypothetical protein